MEYRPTEWDARAQQLWRDLNVYRADFPSDRNPFYVLDMFPYPSGAGLHVGHPLGYIASDIVSRFRRHQGFNVLHPMGFDAFGLPAEQYAIQTGQHPAVTTEVNIERYREQLNRLGLGFDWSREVQTCDPDYYRWTQWIFIQLFGAWYNKQSERAEPIETLVAHLNARGTEGLNAACHGEPECTKTEWVAMDAAQREALLQHFRLAYRSESLVNWCPALGTVLANDEVVNGLSERGGHPVVQKPMLQWSMRISAFAQRLLDGLDELNWSDSIKESQRHWIGRSQGARIRFRVLAGNAGEVGQGTRSGQHRRGQHTERGEHALRLALLRMLLRDMRDLVADHRGELGLRVQVHQQAAMQINEAATGGEGVDGVIVDDDELPLRIGELAHLGDALPDLADVVLQRLILVDAVGLEDLLVRLACARAFLGLLRLRLAEAHRSGSQQQQCQACRDEPSHVAHRHDDLGGPKTSRSSLAR